MTDRQPIHWLQLKTLLRDVHPAVWRRFRLVDSLSIADLHQVIQVLMGWEDDHLHHFRTHGRDYGITYIGGPIFAEDAAAVPLSCLAFRPSERFLYEYDLTAGWQIEVRVARLAFRRASRNPPATKTRRVGIDHLSTLRKRAVTRDRQLPETATRFRYFRTSP
jgi:hypothetical protein